MPNRKTILHLLILFAIPFFGLAQAPAKASVKKGQPLDLKIQVKGITGGNCILAVHYADKERFVDSVKADAKGNIEFKDTTQPGGIYIVILPDKKAFDVILTDVQKFSIATDTSDIYANMKFTGSKENQYFYEYLNYLTVEQKQMEAVQNKLKTEKNKDSIAAMQKKSAAIDSIVKNYKRAYYKTKHPETFMAEVLRAMDEPDPIPFSKYPRKADGTIIDSNYNYHYYKAHYFDGMDFTDDRLIRTPVYANKMKYYLDKLTPPGPDSIEVACDYLIAKTRPSKELYLYTVATVTTKYETSQIMGYDAIFVYLVDKYYKTNQVWWVGDEQMKKIVNRANQLTYTLLGNPATNISMKDTSGTIRDLSSVQAKYTVIIYWDPTCSHCKKEVPLLKAYYDSLHAAGVSIEVYAIYSELDYPTWKKYIKDNKLTWINVAAKDEMELATEKFYYDVNKTPTIYVVDEHKTFFGKQLDVDGLKAVVNHRIQMDKKGGK